MITSFLKSSIGKKWIVALTGLVLIGYVIGHLIGNLQIFLPDKGQINAYGAMLHYSPALLWVIRTFLIGCFVLHIVMTIKLAAENRAARGPERYAVSRPQKTTLAARTMLVSGLIVLCFVIYHILHFTTHTTNPEFKGFHQELPGGGERHDVYRMVVTGLSNPYAAAFYLLGVFLLCSHLSHGFSSVLQTFGLNSRKTVHFLAVGGRLLAWIIFALYAAIPIAALTGFLKLTP
jgi:succinate dehydrogenase / fumarate reductase cytochrome b subunit